MKDPNQTEKIIVIVGSTASGKSDLAILLAQKYDGMVLRRQFSLIVNLLIAPVILGLVFSPFLFSFNAVKCCHKNYLVKKIIFKWQIPTICLDKFNINPDFFRIFFSKLEHFF